MSGATATRGPSSELGLLLAGTGRPLRRAILRLDEDSRRITRAFRRLLRRLEPQRRNYEALLGVAALVSRPPLAKGGLAGAAGQEAYRIAVEHSASMLIRSGVPEDHAIAALGLQLEASLGSFANLAEARALVRLTSATQGLMAAAYCEARVVGLRRLDDRERQKLSGDLHDDVGSDLVVLKLYVEMIAAEVAAGDRGLGPKLEEALALIGHAIDSVRRLTLDLGPAFLDSLGFLPALRGLVRQFSRRTGIEVRLEESAAPVMLPPGHETALYRVLLGALSNVAKHSKARHARVTLSLAGSVLTMSVEDDGKGFDVQAQTPDSSFGLQAMRERVRGLHGRLSVRSRRALRRGDKSGTRVVARVPLRKKAGS